MSRNIVETILGGVVLTIAIGFVLWAYGRSEMGISGGYRLSAEFDKVDGLNVGADVRISGIKVGQVEGQELNPQTFRARVWFTVASGLVLPLDSSAAIVSTGLLGGKYLSVVPGGDVETLKDGDALTLTQSSLNLEDLIGQYIFSQRGGPQQPGGAAPGGAPPGQAPAP